LVVAGPGTGKTKVVTSRIAQLITTHQIAPERILALTFTEKAAREMEERLDHMLPLGMATVSVGTFHAFAADLIGRYPVQSKTKSGARIISESEERAFLRQHLERFPATSLPLFSDPGGTLGLLQGFIDAYQNEDRSLTELAQLTSDLPQESTGEQETITELTALIGLAEVRGTLLQEAGLMSYGDVIAAALHLLRTSARIREEIAQQYTYVLVDEYQDVNVAQARLAELLLTPAQNLMVVGDDDQAIYGFRGASVSNLLGFRQRFPKATIISLQTSFRAGQAILDTSYRLIQHNNPHRLEFLERIPKRLTSGKQEAGSVEHLHATHSSGEVHLVAQKITELIASGIEPGDIALIARSWGHLTGFSHTLKGQGIPVSDLKQQGLWEHPAIRSCLCFLRLIATPRNDLNTFQLLTEVPVQQPLAQVHTWHEAAKYEHRSLFTQLTEHVTDLPKLTDQLTRWVATLRMRPASQALLTFLTETGWAEKMRNPAGDPTDLIAWDMISQLFSHLQNLEEQAICPTTHSFIEYFDQLQANGGAENVRGGEVREGVQLLTAHASKGLEFTAVFVVNMVRRRFPGDNRRPAYPFPESFRANENDPSSVHELEERRLAYVAFTRAKQYLYLTSAEYYGDSSRSVKLSPFIVEALTSPSEAQQVTVQFSEAPLHDEVLTKPTRVPLPRRLAASALETFLECPKRYEYQYVLNLRAPSSGAANFGTSIHRTLQRYLAARQAGEVVSLQELYTECWIPGGFESALHELEAKQEGLTSLERYCSDLPEKLATDLELRVALTIAGQQVSGSIDRVDTQPDGSLIIIDYKTSKKVKEAKAVAESIPLAVYARALEQRGKQIDSVALHFVLAGGNTALNPAELTYHREGALEDIVTSIKQAHEAGSFTATPGFTICQYCDYKEICPFAFGRSPH
jgi:DNA helicase-2/ATP-dependent DNA helicase PcrA